MRRRRPERAPGDQAEDERNAPGERDEYRRPAACEQGVLPEHPETALQFKERPAMRGEIFPDPARLVPVGVDVVSGAHAPHDARHFSIPLRPRSMATPAETSPAGPRPSWLERLGRASGLAAIGLDCASYCRIFEIAGRALIPAPPTTAPPPRSGTRAGPGCAENWFRPDGRRNNSRTASRRWS